MGRIPAKYYKYIVFANYIDHKLLPDIVASGDLFPIMSLGDNFPGTVAEISLAAKPILALKRGGVAEMLTNRKGKFIAYNLGSNLCKASSNLAQGILYLEKNKKKQKKWVFNKGIIFCMNITQKK